MSKGMLERIDARPLYGSGPYNRSRCSRYDLKVLGLVKRLGAAQKRRRAA